MSTPINSKKFTFMNMETSDKLRRLCLERDKKRKDIIEVTKANKSTVSTWFNGISKPSGEYLIRLCRLFDVDGEWLRDDSSGWESRQDSSLRHQIREPQAEYLAGVDTWDSNTPLDSEEVELPFFTEVEAAAGSGQMEVRENHGPKLRFSKATLNRCGIDKNSAACIKVKGNSMEPVLPDESTIGVDTSSTKIIDGKMFAIDHDGMLRVKMLYRLPGGGMRLRSYNSDEHPDETYNTEESQHIRIIGRVFWSSVLY